MRTEPSEQSSKVKLPNATRPDPAAPTSSLDVRAVEDLAQPLLAGGEPVGPGGQRDPRRLAPADQARAMPYPGERRRLRELAIRSPGSGTGALRTTRRSPP